MGLSENDRAFLQTLLEEEIVSPTGLSRACMNASSIIDVSEKIAGEADDLKLLVMAMRFNRDFAYIPECGISDAVFSEYGASKIFEIAKGYGAMPLVRHESGLFVGVLRSWPFDEAGLKLACNVENVQWLAMTAGEFLTALKKRKIISDTPP